jgi:hypothetical protein
VAVEDYVSDLALVLDDLKLTFPYPGRAQSRRRSSPRVKPKSSD